MRALSLLLALLLLTSAGCQSLPPARQAELQEAAARAENQGQYAVAADRYRELMAGQPEVAQWSIEAGRCLGMSGNFRDALDLLEAGRKRFPNAVDLTAMLARTLLLHAESGLAIEPKILWADSQALAQEVLAADASHLDARLLLAQIHFLRNELDAAEQQANEGTRRHPEHPGAFLLLGRIATARCRFQLDLLAAQVAAADEVKAALTAAFNEQREQASAAFRTAARLDPSRAHPHLGLAQLALMEQKAALARTHFGDALVADPNHRLDHGALCRELSAQERIAFYRGLAERYAARRDAKPSHAATLEWHLARAYFDSEQWQQAQEHFAAAYAANPTHTNSLYYLSLASYRRNDHDAAEQHAAAYAALGAAQFADVLRGIDANQRGEFCAILRYLADRAFQSGRKPASRDLNHVLACLLDSADAWNNHAFLCRETGEFAAALASYQHAIEREPTSPQLWNDAGVILQYHLASSENRSKAKAMYERALELAGKILAEPNASAAERELASAAQANAKLNLAELSK